MIAICFFGVQTSHIWCGDDCVHMSAFFLNPVYICGRAVPAIFVDLVQEKQEIMKYMSKYYKKASHEAGTVTFVM